ncbi:hypothetical protein [Leeuwenhoekiella sp. LLG6367-2.1]|mgnify:FL=1|uniref:hypothetical protein n=1 Tax=Leeuwenhoekiella sp. LLG6367-2.1 TaxID=3160833 RepID=UPI00386EC854|tara:strand:+ start:1715 stop:2062 length:348 start_codon:yes stop_codon:yes gene_type:complete
MKNINIIYRNHSGISFYWKSANDDMLKAQVVFRDTGFYFTVDQLKTFAFQTQVAKTQYTCNDCPNPKDCRSLLLKTPSDCIDLAVSKQELDDMQDLLDQTILRMEAQSYMQTALN